MYNVEYGLYVKDIVVVYDSFNSKTNILQHIHTNFKGTHFCLKS